jgi:hypothetical protein
MNRCTEVIRLHLDEELKALIEELAHREERAVSEWIRVRLRVLIYGLAHEARLSQGEARVKGRWGPRRAWELISGNPNRAVVIERCPHCGGVVEVQGDDNVTNFLPLLYWWCKTCRLAVNPVDQRRMSYARSDR